MNYCSCFIKLFIWHRWKLPLDHFPLNLNMIVTFSPLNIKYESQYQGQKEKGKVLTTKWTSTFSLFLSVSLSVVFLVWKDSGWSWMIYCTLRVQMGKGHHFHLPTSEYVGHRLSVKLLDLWPSAGSARGSVVMAGSFLPVRPMCRGTRLGALVIFAGVFLSGAGVVTCFAALPVGADPLPEPCFPPRVPLAATEAVNVSSSWEADPNRTCSSVSAASENRDRAPLRLLQESQHSLL